MNPAAGLLNGHGHLVLGGGGITVDPDINLQQEAWWLHSVFSCPLHAEAAMTALQYAGVKSLVEDRIPIPGNRNKATTSRARNNLLVLLRRSYDVLWRLQRAGFTLQGQFSAENFLIYLETFDVRLSGRLHICRYSPEGGIQDHRAFARSVRQMLTLRESVPTHIVDWLDLIDEGGVGYQYLIRFNISLMEPRQALSTLMSLRRKLEELRTTDGRVYRIIMQLLSPYDNWHLTRCRNSLLHQTRRHTERRLRRRGAGFHPTARGMLTVIRHCSQHAARRYEHLMMLIIEDEFRRSAAFFQRVMYCMSQLDFLSLGVSMG